LAFKICNKLNLPANIKSLHNKFNVPKYILFNTLNKAQGIQNIKIIKKKFSLK